MKRRVRSYYNYDRREASLNTGFASTDISRAVQSQKDEANINTIVRNFGVTGQLPVGVKIPTYGDFDGIDDYRTAIHAVREAEKNFNALPSDLRKRLDFDPQKFLDYAADPANLEEMRKLGLADPAQVVPAAPAYPPA